MIVFIGGIFMLRGCQQLRDMYNCKRPCIIPRVPCQLVNHPVAVVRAVFSYAVIFSCQINCLLVPVFVECAQLRPRKVFIHEFSQHFPPVPRLHVVKQFRVQHHADAVILFFAFDLRNGITVPRVLRQQCSIPSEVGPFVLPFLCRQLPAAGRLIGLILAAIGSCVWATMRFARKSSKRSADHARPRA